MALAVAVMTGDAVLCVVCDAAGEEDGVASPAIAGRVMLVGGLDGCSAALHAGRRVAKMAIRSSAAQRNEKVTVGAALERPLALTPAAASRRFDADHIAGF